MPIQYLCPECGNWLQVSAEHIGSTARCPECEHHSTIPAESDRPIAEDTCFYCSALLEQTNKKRESEEFPTCDECRASMDLNSQEIAEELAEHERFKGVAIRFGVLVLAALLLWWLLSSLYSLLMAAHDATSWPTCALADDHSAPTAGLPAPGVPTPVE